MRMAHASPMQARQAFAKRSRLAIAVFNPSRVSGFSSQENLGKFSGKDAAALLRVAWVRVKIIARHTKRNLGCIGLSGVWLDSSLRYPSRGSFALYVPVSRHLISAFVNRFPAGGR